MENGKCKEDNISKSSKLKPGQEIVMTNWAGGQGTSIIAEKQEEELKQRFTEDFINQAKDLMDNTLALEAAKTATDMGAVFIHEISEGGVFGALWELGKASSVGLEVGINKIPIKQETIEICEFYDLNPYELISSGCLLIVIDRAYPLVTKLKASNIKAELIGRITQGNGRLVVNGDYKRYLSPVKGDELDKMSGIL